MTLNCCRKSELTLSLLFPELRLIAQRPAFALSWPSLSLHFCHLNSVLPCSSRASARAECAFTSLCSAATKSLSRPSQAFSIPLLTPLALLLLLLLL